MFTKLLAGIAVVLPMLGLGAPDATVTRQELSFKEIGARDIRSNQPCELGSCSFRQTATGPTAFA